MRFERSLACDANASSAARRALGECLDSSEDRALIDTIRLATSELISNAVRHGHVASGGRIRLLIHQTRQAVRIDVEQPTSAADAAIGGTDGREVEGGFGLAIVDAVSDRWGVTPDRPGRIWFEVDRT